MFKFQTSDLNEMLQGNTNNFTETSVLSEMIQMGQKPSILVISGNNQTSGTVQSALSRIDLNLFFAETRERAFEFIKNKPDINLILFDLTDEGDEFGNLFNNLNPESDEYFLLSNIPIILIVLKKQIQNVLDLFSENVIDFMIFPMTDFDFLSRIKLHLSVLVSNKKMKHLTLQLHTILEGTRNIAKTRDSLTAATVACSFILRLTEIKEASLSAILLPRSSFQNGAAFIAHNPIEGFNLLTNPSETEITEYDGIRLGDIKKLFFLNKLLLIPVISEEETLAILLFNNIHESKLKIDCRDCILGIVDSLAIVLKNFRHEDHSRLANIGQMAAAIIHDLKNYTVVIRNSAKLALDDSLSSNEKFQFLNNISYESERMLEMTRDILDFSRGDLSISVIRIDAAKYISRLQQFLSPLCEARETNLTINSNIDSNITIDPARLQRAIFNIAVNACDAMENNPPGNKNLILNINRRGAILVIELSDSGCGIAPEIKDRIFEPFISGKKNGGTGLGMSIARSIVEAHGGTIEFQSTRTAGTTFLIQIPQRVAES